MQGAEPLAALPAGCLGELDRVVLAAVVFDRLAFYLGAGSARAAPAGTGRRAAARPAGRPARDAGRRRRAASIARRKVASCSETGRQRSGSAVVQTRSRLVR